MTWLYILLDVVIIILLGILCWFVFRLCTKKNGLNIGSLSQFRNDDLYAQSLEDQKRLAHIEDTLTEPEEEIPDEVEPGTEISDADITFSSGYGVNRETEDSDED